ncbi:tetratricopeptide repeat protein [Saccharopolyspora flava]|uniref:Tetratricopeptide repeat-containing protein n=1 Tax=Saccharopolyspora flava TaxID=95161 RepID=A0A1I6QSZ7_9PSEU|nr:tetratricopeptide repeat protein [Saccharopolyspora flava]SFS55500.1 Tetratricopeptide repeat-containing protein [Saccharopolyspora flava]
MRNEFSGSAGNVVQGGIAGDVHFHAAEVRREPAREVPPAPVGFVDREGPRAVLDAVLAEERRGRAGFVVISGAGGVGTSALMTMWVHEVADEFDDVLWIDFGGRARSLDDVAARCLRSLGAADEDVPASAADRIAQLRSRTSGRRVLFGFDHVADPEPLLELLPAAPGCVVVCTAATDAPELAIDGARPIRLSALEPEHALDYLRERGIAVDDDLASATEVVELCGRVPRALRLIVGQMFKRRWNLARAARELREHRRDHLRDALTAYDVAVAGLTDAQARCYRALGGFPGTAFSAEAIAALAGDPDAGDHLAELHRSCLVEANDQEQYLLPALAAEHVGAVADDDALRRLVAWYRRIGGFADRAVMDPNRFRAVDDRIEGDNPFTRTTGREWLERERLNLLAVIRAASARGWDSDVVVLCESPLWALHNQHKNYADTLSALVIGVESARRPGGELAEVRLRSLRGQLLTELGRLDEAAVECETAVELAERIGHRRGLASAVEFLGKVRYAQGEFAESIALHTRSEEINRELGKPRGEAIQQHRMAMAHIALGEPKRALELLRKALPCFEERGDVRLVQRVWAEMGRAHQALGEHDDAVSALRESVSIARQRGVSFDLAGALELLADSLTGAEREQALRDALAIYAQAHSPRAERVREKLTG